MLLSSRHWAAPLRCAQHRRSAQPAALANRSVNLSCSTSGRDLVECSSSSAEPLQPSRRSALLGMLAGAVWISQQPSAWASDTAKLPKAYREVVRVVIKELRSVIDAEAAGEKETELRRKAEPVKEALQTFVKRWRDDARVAGHPSHKEMVAVLGELGTFYAKAGPRARMTPEVQASLTRHLNAAEASLLPPLAGFSEGEEEEGGELNRLLPMA